MERSRDITDLLAIMASLRNPETGCPWDVEQTFASVAPYTIEEAYEVADAIGRGDLDDLRDELGDLLLQVVFHARMAEEQGAFDFGGVVDAVTAKMIRRHPHVFGDARTLASGEVKQLWAQIKAGEKQDRQARRGTAPAQHLDDVPANHPALTQACKLQARAATVGFDWPEWAQVAAKVREELAEVSDALGRGSGPEIEEEIGDLLFAVVNLARHADVDPDSALRRGNLKFRRRFGYIESELSAQGRSLGDASLDEMEALWAAAKEFEKR